MLKTHSNKILHFFEGADLIIFEGKTVNPDIHSFDSHCICTPGNSVYTGIRIVSAFWSVQYWMGGFPSLTQCAQFANWVTVFWNFAKKAPNLAQIECFSVENGILKGPKVVLFIRNTYSER